MIARRRFRDRFPSGGRPGRGSCSRPGRPGTTRSRWRRAPPSSRSGCPECLVDVQQARSNVGLRWPQRDVCKGRPSINTCLKTPLHIMQPRSSVTVANDLNSEGFLVGQAASRLLAHFTAQHPRFTWRIAREIAVGRTIPDLIILGHHPAYAVSWPALSAQDSVLVSHIRMLGTAPIDALTVMRKRDPSLNDSIESLVRRGVLTRSRAGSISLRPELRRKGRLIAIEAKITKWRQAVTQATAYLRFADEAYVLLPQATAQRATQEWDRFRAAGVGLVASIDDGIRVLHRGGRSHSHDWRREYIYSRAFARAEPL